MVSVGLHGKDASNETKESRELLSSANEGIVAGLYCPVGWESHNTS
jgi:hypothetical protein